MKELSDGTQVTSRSYYFLLDFNDRDGWKTLVDNFNDEVDNIQEGFSDVESSLFEVRTEVSTLNASFIEIFTGSWHIVESLTGTSDKYLTSHLKGERIKIYWSMDGEHPNSWIDIKIYYSNGTLWQSAGSSGIFGVFENEANLEISGEYIVWIRVNDINLWKVEILEYY